ncbi:hypothetical protein T12_2650 [Trichinella patagoniensis]|uniref:Uncharacterized protein n=1 Tax=Trichinella patagoniensis TaxID=990121 RepID=A0A0V0ZZH2_9BILA|nr:hypothetical protein T12_2650 [Trichinella patagoniensis]
MGILDINGMRNQSSKIADYVIAAELFWSLFRSGHVVHHAHQFDLNVALQTLISIAFAADCSSLAHSVEGDVVTSFSVPCVVSFIIRPIPIPPGHNGHLELAVTMCLPQNNGSRQRNQRIKPFSRSRYHSLYGDSHLYLESLKVFYISNRQSAVLMFLEILESHR